MFGTAVKMLGEHKIVAWMQGRMEFGRAALGNRASWRRRSIHIDRKTLNVFIKHRSRSAIRGHPFRGAWLRNTFDAGPNARTSRR